MHAGELRAGLRGALAGGVRRGAAIAAYLVFLQHAVDGDALASVVAGTLDGHAGVLLGIHVVVPEAGVFLHAGEQSLAHLAGAGRRGGAVDVLVEVAARGVVVGGHTAGLDAGDGPTFYGVGQTRQAGGDQQRDGHGQAVKGGFLGVLAHGETPCGEWEGRMALPLAAGRQGGFRQDRANIRGLAFDTAALTCGGVQITHTALFIIHPK